MNRDRVDCVVVGAGAIGLAVARALALAGREVVVLEANARIGEEASSRNNEVIHAGFLYPPHQLKAKLCSKGAEMLYAYCEARGIAHRRIGKLMPALEQPEIELLQALIAQGHANGVPNLALLTREEVRRLEPELHCLAALHSAGTGIVDTHSLMLGYQADAERFGAWIAFNSMATGGALTNRGFRVEVRSAGQAAAIDCEVLVNCAGLGATEFARKLAGYPQQRVPKVSFAKGVFYAMRGQPPFSHLIVPLGRTLASGAAFTLDAGGQGKFGPDVEWVEERDYGVPPDRASSFADAIRRYYPRIDQARIYPSYAGIRVRSSGPGQPLGDWVIEGPAQHGIPGLVQMFAVESPGLTSSLALALHACQALGISNMELVH